MILRTEADGNVVDGMTECVHTASARTRIGALVIHAALILGTVGVHHTLGSAGQVRVAVVIGQAVTCHSALVFFAVSVGTALLSVA